MFPFLFSLLGAILIGWSYFSLAKRSPLGYALIAADFLFILGICIYPTGFVAGYVTPGVEGVSYLSRHPAPGVEVAIHVLMVGVGAAFGATLSAYGCRSNNTEKIVGIARILAPTNKSWFILLFVGLVIYAIYFHLVGFDTALANASAARSGYFEGFGEDDKFLFLKTVAGISLYACTAIPFIGKLHSGRGRVLFGLMFLALLAAAFANSISRIMVLKYLIAPFLVLFAVSGKGLGKSSAKIVLATTLILVGGATAMYGKAVGQYLRYTHGGGAIYSLEVFNEGRNPVETILRNGEFLWYSTAAGIEYNRDNGVVVPTPDILLSIFGFVPQRIMGWLGVEELDYRRLVGRRDTLACINSEGLGLVGCTAPPHWIGYSAYFIPFFGGLLFGFVRFFLYGRFVRYWNSVWESDPKRSWIIYLVALLFVEITTMIPGAISAASFVAMLLASLLVVRLGMKTLLAERKF